VDELQAVLGGRAATPADLPALDWLMASLKEAMRLFPPIAALMTRRVRRSVQLGPWMVPAGALLRLTPWVLHHDPRWFPEPQAFKPERFTADAEPPPRGAWLPFGTGPRVCMGQHFALLEMGLVAAGLLQRYALAPLPGQAAPVPVLNVTLRPQGEMPLRLSRRT
jgi:cytochrome P450